jgi:hypothetical protein
VPLLGAGLVDGAGGLGGLILLLVVWAAVSRR